jgi:thiol-disulfide isomerase/thioredoxin
MKPDFEKLAIEWKGHAVGLVAGIDCTEEDELCQKFSVQGFPTIVYGDPSEPEVSSSWTNKLFVTILVRRTADLIRAVTSCCHHLTELRGRPDLRSTCRICQGES